MINELRIGNWVLNKDIPVQFAGIDLDYDTPRVTYYDDNFDHGYGSVHPDNLKPVLLTPELLAKCGFPKPWFTHYLGQNTMRDGSGNYDGYYINLRRNSDLIYIPVLITCKYLHELQNAVFTIFKEELNYTP